MERDILAKIELRDRHRWTGRTKHYAKGRIVERATGLAIRRGPTGKGCELVHLDEQGAEMITTFHARLEDAMDQARWEFEVEPEDWTRHD